MYPVFVIIEHIVCIYIFFNMVHEMSQNHILKIQWSAKAYNSQIILKYIKSSCNYMVIFLLVTWVVPKVCFRHEGVFKLKLTWSSI